MNFCSDNTAAVAPEIMAAMTAANEGVATSYGEDRLSRSLDDAFSALFEREVRVFTVASGTAANAIALASLTPPWGAIACHREAHIETDEAGAPQFFSGAKLVLLDGLAAKIAPDAVQVVSGRRDIHASQVTTVSVSQTTERGAVYSVAELAALGGETKRLGLKLHMDGARFANAVAALKCAPAALTAGVDTLSFGATKNGAMGAEAIVVFDLARAEEIAHRRKRAGHLLCKGRYPAAQLLAYLKGGLWLRLAERSNALAAKLGEAAAPFLTTPVESNQVFFRPPEGGLAKLRAAGADFLDWGPGEARLVTAWNQDEAEVDAMCALLRALT